MSSNVQSADVAGDPGIAQAQRQLDDATKVWVDIGIEAGLLVASSVPGLGAPADAISLARSVATGDLVGATLDVIGFVPFGGDAIKGFFKGRRIARAVKAADDALDIARTAMSRATEFARRRVAAAKHWSALKQRRQAIKDKYKNCSTAACAEARDAELRSASSLPAKDKGDFVDKNGNPVAAGEGFFKPKPGTRLHAALSRHQQPPMTGIPYNDGVPDLSGFPPPGRHNSAPDGGAYQVDINQSMTGDKAFNQAQDRNSSWGAWRDQYGQTRRDPSGGHWHHAPDGVSMQYVDQDIHGALSHEGAASMNMSPEF